MSLVSIIFVRNKISVLTDAYIQTYIYTHKHTHIHTNTHTHTHIHTYHKHINYIV